MFNHIVMRLIILFFVLGLTGLRAGDRLAHLSANHQLLPGRID